MLVLGLLRAEREATYPDRRLLRYLGKRTLVELGRANEAKGLPDTSKATPS